MKPYFAMMLMLMLMRVALAGVAIFPVFSRAAEPMPVAARAIAFGKCLVSADRGAAITLYQLLPINSSEVDPGSIRVGNGAPCLRGSGILPATLLRGAIAEALYLRDFRDAGIRPHRAASDFAQLGLPEGAADPNGMFALGRCVVRSRFAMIDKLFAVPPTSRRETEFIDTLMPYISACRANAPKIGLKRSEFRALIAQSAYEENARYWVTRSTMGGVQ